MDNLDYSPQEIKYGLIAIDPIQEGEMKNVLHFCGYWEQPTLIDVESLRKELAEDPEFGLTEIAHRLEIIPASEEIIRDFIKEIE